MREGGAAGSQPMSTAVQWYTGAQISFGDLTPYLTYGTKALVLRYIHIVCTAYTVTTYASCQDRKTRWIMDMYEWDTCLTNMTFLSIIWGKS